jgi:hypothetical protein
MRSTVKRIGVLLAVLMMITSCGGNDHPAEPVKTSATPGLSQSETTDIATEAYAYAYPLVTMEYTRRGLTNVPGAEDTKAPMGQIARMRSYPNASERGTSHRSRRLRKGCCLQGLFGYPARGAPCSQVARQSRSSFCLS